MSDIEIARKAKKQNIKEIAVKLNLKEIFTYMILMIKNIFVMFIIFSS